MAVKTVTKKIKLSVTELSALYDRIYDVADKLFKKYNPCGIHVIDGGLKCASRKTSTSYGLCCGGCKYLLKTGCTIKCLPCKLFICSLFIYDYDKNGRAIRNKKYKVFTDKLERLRQIATKYGIYTYAFFSTKEDVLDISMKRKGNFLSDI